MPRNARFWVTVTVIGLAHIVVFVGLVRWSREQKKTSLQEVIWMSGGAGNAGEAGVASVPPISPLMETPRPTPEITTQPPPREEIEKHPTIPPAKSDIEMPTPAPAPTATATPKPAPKATSKPKPELTSKKAATPKAPSKTAKEKPLATVALRKKKSGDDKGEPDKPAKKVSAAGGSRKSDRSGGGGHGNGAGSASEFGWYGNMLHDRFYSEWEQPTTVVASGAKLSVLVRLRIEKSGRVSDFTIIRPSGNVVIDESVAAVAKRVTQVDPLPAGLGGDHYEVRINFELNPE